MDNRTIDEVRKNEDRLINEIKLLEQENQKYKEVIDKAINKIEDLRMEKWSITGTDIIDVLNILKEVD